jgi:hypothetical protein
VISKTYSYPSGPKYAALAVKHWIRRSNKAAVETSRVRSGVWAVTVWSDGEVTDTMLVSESDGEILVEGRSRYFPE